MRSMVRTPAMELMRTGKKTPTAMNTHLDSSPMPKMSMMSGRIALFGTGYTARTHGRSPMRIPRATPGRAPRANPTRMRARLMRRFAHNSPLWAVRQASTRIAVGAGKKRTSIRWARARASHRPMTRTGDSRERSLGEGCTVVQRVPQDLPQAGDMPPVLGIGAESDNSPGPGEGHGHGRHHAAGRGGHHDDAVSQREGLVDAVGDEDDGLPGLLEEPQELGLHHE